MQKEFEEIKILLNKVNINNNNVNSSEIEDNIKIRVNKIKNFIDQSTDETLNKSSMIPQIEEILKLIASKEKVSSKIFEEFKNYLEKKK